MRHVLWLLFGVLAMSMFTGNPLPAAEARIPVAEFTAVRMPKPPVLDGRAEAAEWGRAFTTSGVIAAFEHQLLNSDTTMSVAWDPQNLYFLFRCKRGPAEWRLTKGVRFNDDYDFGDPSIEIWMAPPKAVAETYQNILNTYPAVLDNHQIPSRGYTGAGWRGNWKLGVQEDADGYTLEAAIPVADFGMPDLKDGDRWRLLLCRTCQGSSPRSQGSWSATQGFSEIPQYPPVVFRDDEVAVQVEGVHTLLSGNYHVPLTLVAPRSTDAQVKVEVRWHKGPVPGDASDLVEIKDVRLPAGDRSALDLKGAVPGQFTAEVTEQQIVDGKRQSVRVERPKGVLTITVLRSGGATIFRQSFPYTATGWTWSRPQKPAKAPEIKPLATSVKYGPETHTMMLRADILDLPQRAKAAGAKVRVLDPAQDDRELLSAPLPAFREYYSDLFLRLDGIEAPLWDHRKDDAAAAAVRDAREANRDRKAAQPVPGLPKGPLPRTVAVEVTVADADGKVLATDRQELALLRHRFTWQGNDVGITDKVIPPWTPVEARPGRFAVWNRAMDLDGLGCARQIANGGTQQIQSMRLVAVVDGKEIVLEAGSPRIEKTAEAWAEFTGSGKGAGLALSARSRLEFDGYLVTDLTIAPATAATGAKIDQLYWEVVLPESEATHFCTTAGGWAAVHDVTPPRWTSQQTGSGMLAGDFVPYIWLTNSDRALLWFADNDRGWVTEPDRRVPTQEVVRGDGRVVFRVRFVEVPTELKAPTTVRHGWMAFPSRPLPPGFRSVICAQGKGDYPSARNTHFWANADWAVLWPYYCSPFPWSMQRSKAELDRSMQHSGPDHRPCVGSIAHSIGRYLDYEGRDFGAFSVDWGDMPGVISNSDVTQSRGPIDFRLWHYRRWVREGSFQALYIDENYLSFDRNPLTGGAYVRSDGRVQPGYTYTGLREYFKRMMLMFHAEGRPRPNLWQHISSGAAYHAWYGDILMEGENVEPTNEEADYIEVLPAGRMRAIGSAVCNGGNTIMMCQSQRHPTPWEPKHTHQFVGWILAHDIMPEQVRWFGPMAQAARLHRDDVQFVGYWKPQCPARTGTPDCLVSVHRSADRALLWIVNTARQDRTAAVAIDWKALGLDRSRTEAFNAETGATVGLNGPSLSAPVLRRDFAAVLLVERRALAPGQSFAATFDRGPEADQAIGCEVLAGAAELVKSDHGQALAPGERGVQLWSHLNLRDDAGRVAFRAKCSDGKYGTILRIEAPRAGRDAPLPAPPVVLEVKKTKEGDLVVLRVDVRVEKDAPPPPAISAPAGAGWHEFELSWQGKRLALAVDGKQVGAMPVESLNISSAPGPGIMGMAKFTFGGRGPVEAIDDLRAWRGPSR